MQPHRGTCPASDRSTHRHGTTFMTPQLKRRRFQNCDWNCDRTELRAISHSSLRVESAAKISVFKCGSTRLSGMRERFVFPARLCQLDPASSDFGTLRFAVRFRKRESNYVANPGLDHTTLVAFPQGDTWLRGRVHRTHAPDPGKKQCGKTRSNQSSTHATTCHS